MTPRSVHAFLLFLPFLSCAIVSECLAQEQKWTVDCGFVRDQPKASDYQNRAYGTTDLEYGGGKHRLIVELYNKGNDLLLYHRYTWLSSLPASQGNRFRIVWENDEGGPSGIKTIAPRYACSVKDCAAGFSTLDGTAIVKSYGDTHIGTLRGDYSATPHERRHFLPGPRLFKANYDAACAGRSAGLASFVSPDPARVDQSVAAREAAQPGERTLPERMAPGDCQTVTGLSIDQQSHKQVSLCRQADGWTAQPVAAGLIPSIPIAVKFFPIQNAGRLLFKNRELSLHEYESLANPRTHTGELGICEQQIRQASSSGLPRREWVQSSLVAVYNKPTDFRFTRAFLWQNLRPVVQQQILQNCPSADGITVDIYIAGWDVTRSGNTYETEYAKFLIPSAAAAAEAPAKLAEEIVSDGILRIRLPGPTQDCFHTESQHIQDCSEQSLGLILRNNNLRFTTDVSEQQLAELLDRESSFHRFSILTARKAASQRKADEINAALRPLMEGIVAGRQRLNQLVDTHGIGAGILLVMYGVFDSAPCNDPNLSYPDRQLHECQ